MWRRIVFPFTPEIVTEKIKVDEMESVQKRRKLQTLEVSPH